MGIAFPEFQDCYLSRRCRQSKIDCVFYQYKDKVRFCSMAATIVALTFDWYGTLATHRGKGRSTLFFDYLALHGMQSASWDRRVLYEVFDYYSRVYNPDSSDKEKSGFWTEFTKRLFEHLQVTGCSANQSDLHAEAMCDIFGAGCFQLYADVQPILRGFKRDGLRLAVISNWHRGLDLFIREMHLSDLFETVISSADIGIEKPDPRIFHEAVRQLGSEPDRIVHIGDLPHDDFIGAVSAGLRGILIDRLGKYPTHPDRIENLLELERQLHSFG